jgi:transposase
MTTWTDLTHFAGFDWADDHHDVVVLDRQGAIVDQWTFEHSLEGWTLCRQKLGAYGPSLAIALETSRGLAVDELLQCELSLYPVQPLAASRLRDRKAPSGAKSDRFDGWALAEGLRLDGHAWKALAPEDPLVLELRLLCRDEVVLIQQRTLLVNQLIAALKEYYPTALEAFDDWTLPSSWDFLLAFPTPELLAKAGRRKWEKFLHSHRLWRPQTTEHRLAAFAKVLQWKPSPAVVAAKSRLALSLASLLHKLQNQLEAYRARIEELFARHPDHHLFGSLPGAGPTLAPRLLAELGQDRERFPSTQSLQCLGGTAPVSFQSGQIHRVRIRRQCNRFLRHALHLWAGCSRLKSAWAEAYYQGLRARGKSHACALRCLAQRWLEILWKMWQDRTAYDAEKHLSSLKKHGSITLTQILGAHPAACE